MSIDAASLQGAAEIPLEEDFADVLLAREIAIDEEGKCIDVASLQGCEMPLEEKTADVLLGCGKINVGTCIEHSAAEINNVISARGGTGDETAALKTCEITTVKSKEQDCFTDADQEVERVSDKRSSDGEDDIKLENMCSRALTFDFQGSFQSLQISHPSSGEIGSVPSTEAPVATDKAFAEQVSLVSPDELVQPMADLVPLEENPGSLEEGLCEMAAACKLDCDTLVQPNVNLLPADENYICVKEGLCRTAAACVLDESLGKPDFCGGDNFSKSSRDLDISRLNPVEFTTFTEYFNESGVGSGDESVQPNVNLLPVEENSVSSKEGLCEIADVCMLGESFGRPDSCPVDYFLKTSSDLDISSVNVAEMTTVAESINGAVGNSNELVQPNVNLLPVEENSVISKEGLCGIADLCMLDESVVRPDSCVGGYLSKFSSDIDISRVNLSEVVTLKESINESRLGNDDRKDLARSLRISLVGCPKDMPSSSSCRRDYRDGKSGRRTQAKKGAKNCESLDLIFKGSKGKRRTCSSKAPRSSAWGVFQDLSQHFERMSQVSPKVIERGCGNDSLKDAGGISQGSNGKTNCKRIRLKVKVGNQVVLISEVVDKVATANTRGTVSTMDVKDGDSLERSDKKLDKEKTDYMHANLDTGLIQKGSAGGVEVCSGPPRHVDIGRFLGSETSPDSEVINVMHEPHLTEIHAEVVDNNDLVSAYEDIYLSRKGNKKDKQSFKRRDVRKKMGEDVASLAGAIGLGNSGNVESSSVPRHEELASSNDFMPVENVVMTCNDNKLIPGSIDPDYPNNNVLSQSKKKGQTRKNKKVSASRKNEKEGKIVNKRKVKEMAVRNQVLCDSETSKQTGISTKEPEARSNGHHCIVSASCSQFEMITDQLKHELSPERNAWVRCDECHKWRRIAAILADNIEVTNSSWTCKENIDVSFADCSIPQEKSNAEINAELDVSDEDDDYDAHQNYKDLGSMHPPVSQQSSFIQIDSNKYLHRRRRTQTIDEVMVCYCTPPLSGKWGCGEECLNRMLNIECVQGTCPCGDLCSNQQFQKHNYAKLQWFKCGRKGYGLQLREGVRKGGFIIEYVGEVLDVPSYEARQRDYASKGHKHFYFMTLNGSEVIDACVKGNLGRFINHSCEPNCRTEKWMVNGEICIGLFAVRDIKKGEELTFDYNYVRVFGAAAKKCVCGSSQCRGYIGGDRQSSEVIVQGDSDDEFPEPIMVNEDGTYNMDYVSSATVDGHETPGLEVLPENETHLGGLFKLDNFSAVENSENQLLPAIAQLRVLSASDETLPFPLPLQLKDIAGPPSPAIQRTDSVYEELKEISNAGEVSAVNEPFLKPPPDDASVKPKTHIIDDKGSGIEVRPQIKKSKSSTSIKKCKSGSSTLKVNQNKVKETASKPQSVPAKPKKTIEGSSNARYEAVQGKLSELLDGDGGISKRKDAAKGYLKLLLLTAAGDTINGEAIQSNRDLSMILDALLKTRSKVVLVDIVNKNGLRMLHNIMKQYRRDFKKIPILRKLLKVLEYLALREVLTLEHIIVAPPCIGMESFRESILSFTEHDDKQVHQIARNFRDRWIPRHIRKHGYSIDRDDDRGAMRALNYNSNHSASPNPHWYDSQLRHAEASSMNDSLPTGSTTTSSAENSTAEGTEIRKRKSRWDQDAVPFKSSKCDVDEDAPPGFPTLPDYSKGSSNSSSTNMNQIEEKVEYLRCPFDAVIGQPQERFQPRSPVSYGVPLLILQQFGTPHAGSIDTWAVAPGMPFHPFPPLPPHPVSTKQPSPTTDFIDCGTNKDRSIHPNSMQNQSLPPKCSLSPSNWNSSYCSSDDNAMERQKTPLDSKNPSPSNHLADENHEDGNINSAANTDLQEDTMESSLLENQSQSVFKGLKVSSSSSHPPWVWRRKCWGYSGLNSRVGGSVGSTVVNEKRNSSSSTENLVSKEEMGGKDSQ